LPLFWSFGSANAVPAILTHCGCIVLQEIFEAGEALALIERERCSVYYGMSNMARALLEHEDHPKRRLGAMRTGLTIGPPEDIAMTIEGKHSLSGPAQAAARVLSTGCQFHGRSSVMHRAG
jgi:fatty-acyl-CoA synthase